MTDTYLSNHGMAVQLIARQEGLIERLRGESREAADEIERLRGLLAWHDSTVPEILADNARLRAALESLTKDPPATLAREPDDDAEVIIKMRAIARAALTQDAR